MVESNDGFLQRIVMVVVGHVGGAAAAASVVVVEEEGKGEGKVREMKRYKDTV